MSASNDSAASRLISQIQERAGITQAELARRSGIEASVLSAYAHGRRQPSVSALARVARAAGLELQISELSDEAALERAGRVLIDVIGLADNMPSRRRGELAYPPLIHLAA